MLVIRPMIIIDLPGVENRIYRIVSLIYFIPEKGFLKYELHLSGFNKNDQMSLVSIGCGQENTISNYFNWLQTAVIEWSILQSPYNTTGATFQYKDGVSPV